MLQCSAGSFQEFVHALYRRRAKCRLASAHGAFGFSRGEEFFICVFGTALAPAAFARARAALLAAARLSGDHGVYLKCG